MLNLQSILGIISVALGIILTLLKILEQYDKVSPKITRFLDKSSYAWGILILLLIGIGLYSFFILQKNDLPENINKAINFKESARSLYINVCDDSLPTDWWEHCIKDPERLRVRTGYLHGVAFLESDIEASPHKDQVYSVVIPLDEPKVADNISTKVYIPNKDQISAVVLAIQMDHFDGWITSHLDIVNEGWVELDLDLQHFFLDTGESARSNLVKVIHVDFYVPKTSGISVHSQILIQEVYFKFPASLALLSNP
jgi:hypothetical protein